jgi:hypothetical protein
MSHKTSNLNKIKNLFLSLFYIKSEIGDDYNVAINALLDSGAYSDNFCSLETAKLLQDLGYTIIKTNSRVDMGVRDLSQPIIGKFRNVDFMFLNVVNNQKESLKLNDIYNVKSISNYQ